MPKKKVIKVQPMAYQPTKAELEADASIDATPEELVKAVVQPVNLKHTRKAPKS
ncbi:MAG: hypothetical protein OXG06_01375 [Gammaproteobacteria bacterium]|nr:hypothetical protein [Gammaproteobacteria bacterium]